MDVKPVELKKVENVKVLSISNEGAELEVLMVLRNPNAFAVNLVDAYFDVGLNDDVLGKANLKERVKIPALSEKRHAFKIQSSISPSLLSIASSLFFKGKNDVTLSLKGKAKVRSWGITQKVPLDVKEKISLN